MVAINSFTICSTKSEHSSDCQDVNMTEMNKAQWTAQVCGVIINFYVPAMSDWQTEAEYSQPVRLFVRSSIRSSVTKLVNTVFWKRLKWFWYQLARMVCEATAWNGQLWVKRSRSHEVGDSFGGMASFSTPLGGVGFPVTVCYCAKSACGLLYTWK